MLLRLKLLVFLFCSCIVQAQLLGKHASNINWQQIDNETVKIIYPNGTDSQAKRIADVVAYIRRHKTQSIGDKWRKVEVILQAQQVASNGFVTLSPFRSEFFAVSPQNFTQLGSTNWLDLLAVHEYRHVLQYANVNRGATRLMHLLNGQNGWAAALFLSIPSWQLEGDAVMAETLFSENGRGRNPAFYKEQRSLLLNDIDYTYMKAINGSYKDIIPSEYPLGFAINNHIRNTYGINKTKAILADAGSFKSPFYPFSSAMKRHTGLSASKMYKEAYHKLSKKWKAEAERLTLSKSTAISKPSKKIVTHYTFPQYLEDGSVVCIKRSYQETPHLIRIKNQKEEKLLALNISPQEFISNKNGNFAWTALERDVRRANQTYSNIITYNYKTKVKKSIIRKGKFYSPEFSNDGQKIVAVRSDENVNYQIAILEADSGKEIQKIPNPQNDFISYPKWHQHDDILVYLVKRGSKLAFFKYDLKEAQSTQISDWTSHTIGAYSLLKNKIYYTASYSGIDNIYSIAIDGNRNIKQVSSVAIGAYMPEVNTKGTHVLFSEFTNKGYALKKINLLKNNEETIDPKEPIITNHYNILTTKEEYAILDTIPTQQYEKKAYKGFFKGLKLHSWGLALGRNLEEQQGFRVQVSNILQDFSAGVFLLNNLNEKTNSLFTNITYSKYFVEANLGTSRQKRSTIQQFSNGLNGVSFTEKTLRAGLSIPLSKIKGNYSRSFSIATDYVQHITNDLVNHRFSKFNFGAIESKVSISNFRRTALQNIAPKFGQSLGITLNKSVGRVKANHITINSSFYFPGIFKNHSTRLDAHWKKENLSNDYRYADSFVYARGYNSFWNDEVFSYAVNYELPLAYPDWGFWGLTYFKRIRANLFFDQNKIKTVFNFNESNSENVNILQQNITQRSVGVEFILDNTFLNRIPISIGLRNSFLLDKDILQANKKFDFSVFFQLNI